MGLQGPCIWESRLGQRIVLSLSLSQSCPVTLPESLPLTGARFPH